MKKLLFGLVIMFLFLSAENSFAQTEEVPVIEFVFGRKSQDCGGFGICILKIKVTVKDIKTIATVLARQGNVQIKFKPEFYLQNKNKFVNGYLVLEEDFTLDQETTRALKLAEGYKLKTGKYLVVFDKMTNTYNCTF